MTKREAIALIQWGQEKMGLRAWQFFLDTDDNPPEWCDNDPQPAAAANPDLTRRQCQIWFSQERCELSEYAPEMALFHELMHVVFVEGGMKNQTDYTEFSCTALATTLAELYALVLKRKKKARR